MKRERRGFSRVVAGFLSYNGKFRLPLLLAQGSPVFHSSCEGELGIALESLQEKKRPHLGLCPGPNVSLQGRQGSPVRISDSPRLLAPSPVLGKLVCQGHALCGGCQVASPLQEPGQREGRMRERPGALKRQTGHVEHRPSCRKVRASGLWTVLYSFKMY